MGNYGTRRNLDAKLLTLDNAASCPVCHKHPTLSQDVPAFPYPVRQRDYVLRCPMDHPYVASGYTIHTAVELWNAFVEMRMNEANQLRAAWANPSVHGVLSACADCKTHTRSILIAVGNQLHEQCASCKLMKSVKEVD